jgi:hypothetical protein
MLTSVRAGWSSIHCLYITIKNASESARRRRLQRAKRRLLCFTVLMHQTCSFDSVTCSLPRSSKFWTACSLMILCVIGSPGEGVCICGGCAGAATGICNGYIGKLKGILPIRIDRKRLRTCPPTWFAVAFGSRTSENSGILSLC